MLKIKIRYRVFRTAAKIKSAPSRVMVFIEFSVLVAVSILGEPNTIRGEVIGT